MIRSRSLLWVTFWILHFIWNQLMARLLFWLLAWAAFCHISSTGMWLEWWIGLWSRICGRQDIDINGDRGGDDWSKYWMRHKQIIEKSSQNWHLLVTALYDDSWATFITLIGLMTWVLDCQDLDIFSSAGVGLTTFFYLDLGSGSVLIRIVEGRTRRVRLPSFLRSILRMFWHGVGQLGLRVTRWSDWKRIQRIEWNGIHWIEKRTKLWFRARRGRERERGASCESCNRARSESVMQFAFFCHEPQSWD